jgi:hypothetical protein
MVLQELLGAALFLECADGASRGKGTRNNRPTKVARARARMRPGRAKGCISSGLVGRKRHIDVRAARVSAGAGPALWEVNVGVNRRRAAVIYACAINKKEKQSYK